MFMTQKEPSVIRVENEMKGVKLRKTNEEAHEIHQVIGDNIHSRTIFMVMERKSWSPDSVKAQSAGLSETGFWENDNMCS